VAAEKIRSHPEWSHTPLVALTASATEFEEKKFTEKGFDNYLRKPATLDEILSVLMQFLKYEVPGLKEEESLDISAGTLKHFPEIEKIILTEALPLQQKLMGIRPREEVKKLAGILTNVGKKYQAEEVLRYGERLRIANKNFLLEKEKLLIDNLPNFFNQLKKSYNEHTRK
jgi:CheY-like chemotaxis protein